MKIFFLLYITLVQLSSCSEQKSSISKVNTLDNIEFPKGYNFNKPKNNWRLPMELDEISGLTYYAKNQLACVNDEEGKIFIYNYKERKIIKTIVFGKDGDYEGITYTKPNFFLVKSNGKLSIYNEKTRETRKVKLPFDSKNNIEGLCLENKNFLLFALKGNSRLNGENAPFKAIYRYDVVNNKTVLAYNIPQKKKLGFTGISIHPTNGKLFILSHRTKEIYQIDHNTKVVDYVWELNQKLFPQPEGICFSPDGKLFISTERADKEFAAIFEF